MKINTATREAVGRLSVVQDLVEKMKLTHRECGFTGDEVVAFALPSCRHKVKEIRAAAQKLLVVVRESPPHHHHPTPHPFVCTYIKAPWA